MVPGTYAGKPLLSLHALRAQSQLVVASQCSGVGCLCWWSVTKSTGCCLSWQGLSEVLAELERAHLEYHRSEHRPMLYAASPQVQRAYNLVEGTYQDVGAMPGHPATFRISKVHHILSMEVRYVVQPASPRGVLWECWRCRAWFSATGSSKRTSSCSCNSQWPRSAKTKQLRDQLWMMHKHVNICRSAQSTLLLYSAHCVTAAIWHMYAHPMR
jgi:hypothetical protein